MTRQRVEGGGAGDHFAPFGVNERVLERAGEARGDRARGVRRLLRQRRHRRRSRPRGSGRTTRSPRRSTSSNPAARRRAATATTTWASCTPRRSRAFPEHVQQLSPVLTLQGAVAHSDMPLESGPTMYLPHSQKYVPGYIAMNRPDFQEYFERAPHAAAVATGGCRVLQPGGLPRRGHQPLGRLPPHRQPPADLLGVRAGDGERRPGPDLRGDLPGAAGAPERRSTPLRRRRRATRSRPTSTATPPSTASPRPARPTSSGRRWPRAGTSPLPRRAGRQHLVARHALTPAPGPPPR